MSTVFFRNKHIKAQDLKISHGNRAMRYGDGCFESIRVIDGCPVFWTNHYQRLINTIEYLGIDFDYEQRELCNWISELLTHNKVTNGGLRIQLFRDGGGKYFPETNKGCLLMECSEDGVLGYPAPVLENEAHVFDRIRLPEHEFGNYKALNKSIHIAAAVEARQKGMQEAIILNTAENIAEAVSSNLFILKDGILKTPKLADGCLNGIIRGIIIDSTLSNIKEVREESFGMEELLRSDEIWASNAGSGISVISQIGKATFNAKTANMAQVELCAAALNSCLGFRENLT